MLEVELVCHTIINLIDVSVSCRQDTEYFLNNHNEVCFLKTVLLST